MAEVKEIEKLPEGWKVMRLGEVIKDIGDGGTPSRDDPSNFGNDVYWVVIEDIKPLIINTKEKLSYKGLRNSNAKLWPKGAIIISTGATIGVVGIACVPLATKQGITGIVVKDEYVINKFLYYWFGYNTKLLERFAQGSSFTEIRPPQLVKLIIFLPPLPEQQKIAEILETVDNTIEKTDRIIEKYKRIKQGLMQDLLTRGIDENGNIRSEKTHKFKDSPLGRIPEEWEVVRLGEVCFIIMGQSPSSSLINKEGRGLPFLQGNAEFTDKYPNPINLIEKPLKMANKGSILISVRAPIGALNLANTKYCIGRGLASLESNNDLVNNYFLWYCMQYFINDLIKIGQGSTFEAIGSNELKTLKIPLPSLPEQHRIASILSQIDETIEKEQKYKEKLEQIKQGLMEDLLTGKVRVNHLIEEDKNLKALKGVENVSEA